jgi:hypothetical protein
MTDSRLDYLHQDDVELLFVIKALNGCILSVVVWLVDGTHSNNTPAADLPVQMELATPFRKLRNTSHGGAHFWVGAISIAACSYCLNSMRKRQ